MDWNQIAARWKQARSKVKDKWVRLSDEDLDIIGGQRERLEHKIQERYGFAPEHVHKEIEDWIRCQLAVGTRRRSRKTKLASIRVRRRQRNCAAGSVTAILMPRG
jgi:uncharacterized protein YjbJ (UPF0337 family)